ncbi:RICIN domain-containing protein [Streptomyces sp. NPDC058067]|uniref:RICIN domain-containing protein n=1 Tax=Streptomyces sp. NPDC058067 TaxID=3346324 RepID=UPI0036E47A64
MTSAGGHPNEVAKATFLPLNHIAQATWGAPHPDATYAEFTARAEAVGHAPGWQDTTRVPVPDGTYILSDRGHRTTPAGVRLTRTPDGYVTIASADGTTCLETRSGKLTLNVPLEPGSAVTWEPCDAKDTLQRWQLAAADGGYRITNAITRMTLDADTDGRLVQYPPDQKAPTTWALAQR